jgi:hypothetical protein
MACRNNTPSASFNGCYFLVVLLLAAGGAIAANVLILMAYPHAASKHTIDHFDSPPSNASFVDGTAGGWLTYNGFDYGNDTATSSTLQAVSGIGWAGFNNATEQAEGQPNFAAMNCTVQSFNLNSVYFACISTNSTDSSSLPVS